MIHILSFTSHQPCTCFNIIYVTNSEKILQSIPAASTLAIVWVWDLKYSVLQCWTRESDYFIPTDPPDEGRNFTSQRTKPASKVKYVFLVQNLRQHIWILFHKTSSLVSEKTSHRLSKIPSTVFQQQLNLYVWPCATMHYKHDMETSHFQILYVIHRKTVHKTDTKTLPYILYICTWTNA